MDNNGSGIPTAGWRLFQLIVIVNVVVAIALLANLVPFFPTWTAVIVVSIIAMLTYVYRYVGSVWPREGRFVMYRATIFLVIIVLLAVEAWHVWFWINVFPRKLF